MEDTRSHTLHIEAIREDLNHIVDEWLLLHFRLTMSIVFIAFIVEILMSFFIAQSGIMTTTLPRYILKFIVAPSGVSSLMLLAGLFTMRSKKMPRKAKIYSISIVFTLICLIFFTAHSAFVAMFALFAVAIFLTTTYADYTLTGTISFLAIGCFVVSELFFYWDADKISVFMNSDQMVNFLVALAVLIGCSIVSNVTIYYERMKNETSLRREVERELLKESVQFDELTGAYNRKALHDALRALEQTPITHPLVFGIADIDHFKSVNDLYGHQVGDMCLIEFACVLCEYFGESSVFRYGGDEFCLILKNVALSEALQLCERAQTRLNQVEFENVPGLHLAVSFGLTELTEASGANRLFNQADKALYEAKKIRNTTSVYESSKHSTIRQHIVDLEEGLLS